ncbi:Protein CYCLOPS [Camellia lanceoleosa]|uniref:Protein CYCLOPS n=1 Tax=Camellia lanceoleosa TaxID=1840588 RepID=A0ACC0HPZ3_9ERIC|nr:Protein CYCLOPS [Camellia lanceoleosa]
MSRNTFLNRLIGGKPAELAGSSGQQLGGVLQRKRSNVNLFPQNTALVDEQSSDLNQNSIRNVVERGLQARNLYLAKAWFHSSQPMTRSRSSELRRRYVSMQNSQTSLGVEAMHNVSGHGVNNLRQEFANPNGFGDVSMCEIHNHFNTFMSPSNSASSTFNAPHTDNIDKVSSVVGMLKGTLEHKKLNNETVEDSSLELHAKCSSAPPLHSDELLTPTADSVSSSLSLRRPTTSLTPTPDARLSTLCLSLSISFDGRLLPSSPSTPTTGPPSAVYSVLPSPDSLYFHPIDDEPYKDNKLDLLGPKLLFIAHNLGGLALGVWKLNSLGLLRTHASDWVSSLPPAQMSSSTVNASSSDRLMYFNKNCPTCKKKAMIQISETDRNKNKLFYSYNGCGIFIGWCVPMNSKCGDQEIPRQVERELLRSMTEQVRAMTEQQRSMTEQLGAMTEQQRSTTEQFTFVSAKMQKLEFLMFVLLVIGVLLLMKM